MASIFKVSPSCLNSKSPSIYSFVKPLFITFKEPWFPLQIVYYLLDSIKWQSHSFLNLKWHGFHHFIPNTLLKDREMFLSLQSIDPLM